MTTKTSLQHKLIHPSSIFYPFLIFLAVLIFLLDSHCLSESSRSLNIRQFSMLSTNNDIQCHCRHYCCPRPSPVGKNNATKVTVDCDLQSFASVRQAIEELKVGGCRVSHAISPAVQWTNLLNMEPNVYIYVYILCIYVITVICTCIYWYIYISLNSKKNGQSFFSVSYWLCLMKHERLKFEGIGKSPSWRTFLG